MANNITVSPHWKRIFFPIWTGQVFSLLGSSLVNFALVWYLTKTTGSATVLAMATLVAVLPEVLVGPFAGALVDRWNRRNVMIVADGSIALASVGLALLFWLNIVQPWHIYLIMFLRAIGGIFHWPAMQASTSLMVPNEHLSRVAGINQALRGAVNIVAPPLGALLMSLIPIYGIVGVDVITALIAIVPLLFVHVPQPAVVPETTLTPRQLMKDVAIGFKYVVAWKGVLSIVLLAVGINFLLAPTGTLLPLMVTRIFNGDAWHLSALEAGMGIGIVLGGLVLGVWGGFRKKILTSLFGLVVLGIGTLLMGLTPGKWFWMALVAYFICGFINPIVNGPIFAIMQSKVAPEMQGRVFTLVSAGCAAAIPLSMLIAGPVSDWLGIRIWFIVGGIATMAMGLLAFSNRDITTLEDYPTESAPEPTSNPLPIPPLAE